MTTNTQPQTQQSGGDELKEFLDLLIGPAGWMGDIERLIQAREREGEQRGRIAALDDMYNQRVLVVGPGRSKFMVDANEIKQEKILQQQLAQLKPQAGEGGEG